MGTRYNDIAGQNSERLAALSDGVFAVAMTLLVLDLHVPGFKDIHNDHDLLQALLAIAPRLLMYLMSFLTLGIFWVGQQTQLNYMLRADRNLTWIHLAFLFAVTLTPFSTNLMAEFIAYRLALLLYWGNILLLGLTLLASWRYAMHAKLLPPDAPPEIARWVERRIVIAQLLYAFGAALCVVSTYCSIACIILVQLNYVFAPRIAGLHKL